MIGSSGKVVLVDENDSEIGTKEKLSAHKKGLLHRAFSIFVFNPKGELLLQQRASSKYHSAGLWTNTCCSHPAPGESLESAVVRRLKFEMGFDCDLKKAFHFIYRAEFSNGLIEHEFDHVFIGEFNGVPQANPEEVQAWRWIDWQSLKNEIAENPDRFAYWFTVALTNPYWDRQGAK